MGEEHMSGTKIAALAVGVILLLVRKRDFDVRNRAGGTASQRRVGPGFSTTIV